MYGFLILEDVEKFYSDGFCVVCDGDSQDVFIKNNELEYAEYLLSKISPNVFADITTAFIDSFLNAIGTLSLALGQDFTSVGESLTNKEKVGEIE